MDWEKKFNNIIRDTDANLEKVKSRVMLSHCSSGGCVSPARPDRAPMAALVAHPAAGPRSAADSALAELHVLVRQQASEIKRLSSQQRRQELETEYIRGELSKLRKDVRKALPPCEPDHPLASPRQPESTVSGADDLAWRLTQLERRVAGLEEARKAETAAAAAAAAAARPLGLGTSPLSCVDDHFPAEAVRGRGSPRPAGADQPLTEPLNFNLDDLALSDSDDH